MSSFRCLNLIQVYRQRGRMGETPRPLTTGLDVSSGPVARGCQKFDWAAIFTDKANKIKELCSWEDFHINFNTVEV